MENLVLDYEHRYELFGFLINDYGFIITKDNYYPESFGNYEVILKGLCFSLRYYSDRETVSIEICSLNGLGDWYALSFVWDLIFTPESINSKRPQENNAKQIEKLTNFLKSHYNKICELFNDTNYSNTKKQIDEGLDKQFRLKYL